MKYTFEKQYAAMGKDGGLGNIFTVPDQVGENQKEFDGKTFPAFQSGRKCRVKLRGDWYGLNTPGTGDMRVQLIRMGK